MEALDTLGINLPGLIAQLVNFTLLLIVLYLIAYKPVLRMLDQRSERIRQSMEQAEEIRRQTARAQVEFEARIGQAHQEAQNIVNQALQTGERLRDEARIAARQDAEDIVARARAEIQGERRQAVAELRREFAELSILAAEKVIGQALDRAAHRRLIDEVLADSDRFRLA